MEQASLPVVPGKANHRLRSFALCDSVSWVLSLNNSDYYHYLVWIAESFNTNVLQHFHQKIMITSITYLTSNDYYIHYLQRNRKTRKPRTEAENWDPVITSTNEFHQVTPFSLFHCASNAPQTRRTRALRLILAHRNKTEMPYQVMRDIARNVSPNAPMPPFPHAMSLQTRVWIQTGG
jgi:hypothetical protein